MHFVSVKFNQIRNSNLSMYFLGSHFFQTSGPLSTIKKNLETVALLYHSLLQSNAVYYGSEDQAQITSLMRSASNARSASCKSNLNCFGLFYGFS